jgi:hypothetical protein
MSVPIPVGARLFPVPDRRCPVPGKTVCNLDVILHILSKNYTFSNSAFLFPLKVPQMTIRLTSENFHQELFCSSATVCVTHLPRTRCVVPTPPALTSQTLISSSFQVPRQRHLPRGARLRCMRCADVHPLQIFCACRRSVWGWRSVGCQNFIYDSAVF